MKCVFLRGECEDFCLLACAPWHSGAWEAQASCIPATCSESALLSAREKGASRLERRVNRCELALYIRVQVMAAGEIKVLSVRGKLPVLCCIFKKLFDWSIGVLPCCCLMQNSQKFARK